MNNLDQTPLDSDQTDELLSAELDGEFDAAALDLGMTVVTARARLDATPGVEARRAALRAARVRLGRADEMDELLEQRLRSKAVRAAVEINSARRLDRRRRQHRLLYGAGGIAAASALVFAVAASVHSGPGAKSSAASAPAAVPETSPNNVAGLPGRVALGSFSTARALAAAALSQAAANPARPTTPVPAAGAAVGGGTQNQDGLSTVSGGAPSTVPTTATHPSTGNGNSGGLGAKQSTYATAKNATTPAAPSASPTATGGAVKCSPPPAASTADTEILRATATLSGKPVIVFVFAGPQEHVVVIEDTACRLVNLQMTR